MCPLHDVIKLQHGVRRRIDEDVGQRVLVVVHLICRKRQERPSQLCLSLLHYTAHQPGNDPAQTSGILGVPRLPQQR